MTPLAPIADPSPAPSCTFIYSPDYYCDIGAHVFPTHKFRAVYERLRADADIPPHRFLQPPPATHEDLLLAHTPEYLDDLLAGRRTERTRRSELPLTPQITRAFIMAAGGTLLACRQALEQGIAMNLSGGFHHAYPDHAEGFCYINDVAVALKRLRHDGALRRAVVVDLDVHQGNGTAVMFANEPAVFTFSMHQEKNYPPKEAGSLDIGLDDGTGDDDYLAQLDAHLTSILDQHRPELAVYVAGADVYREDLLGGLALTLEGVRRRDECVARLCRRRKIPLAIVLGGGYAATFEDTVAIHHTTARIAWTSPAPK